MRELAEIRGQKVKDIRFGIDSAAAYMVVLMAGKLSSNRIFPVRPSKVVDTVDFRYITVDYNAIGKETKWWRHQIKTFSTLLAICAGNSLVTGEFPAQRPATRSFEVSLICAWLDGWVNNGEAGDLRRHRVHYDVTVMKSYVHTMNSPKTHHTSPLRVSYGMCCLGSLEKINHKISRVHCSWKTIATILIKTRSLF